MKQLKRSVKGAVKRRARADSAPREEAAKVRRNDPLAIGIEELERSFWPSARNGKLSR